jgi:peptidoglycan/LPS O-acetylase OafA/YrhL
MRTPRQHVTMPAHMSDVTTHHPGLDGLRGIAILVVLLFHAGVGWAAGGFLGVEAFFVLSGFLITSLLIAEWRRTTSIALLAFWARRARRLLPALFCLVFAVGLYQAVVGPASPAAGLKDDGLATLFYFGNWHQIATASSYFAATGPVSPLQHTWSLAIEEQFYIVWPLLFLGVCTLVVGRSRCDGADQRAFRVLLTVAGLGVLGSVVDTMLLFASGRGLDRVYYGTDTRAASILLGAALALGATSLNSGRTQPRRRISQRHVTAVSLVALIAIVAMVGAVGGESRWLYPFGLLGFDLAVATVIATVVFHPRALVSRLCSLLPLRALGAISYGAYLYHFPLFVWLDAGSTGMSGTSLLLLRLTATVLVATISYVVVEQPVRQRRLPRRSVRALAPVAAGSATAMLFVAAAAASSSSTPVVPFPPATAGLSGSQPPCRVRLTDTPNYGLAPMTYDQAAVLQPKWLAARRPKWSGTSRVTFHTCAPKRVLLIGDSLAFSMGLPMMIREQHFGSEVINAAILGCSFGTRGQIDANGRWEDQRPGCRTALDEWRHEEAALHPQVVVVELGFRDEFDWRWGHRIVHLGQPEYDAYLQQQIDRYVTTLAHNHVKVLFLTVPWSSPPPLANGSPQPAGTSQRHREINAMLASAVRRNAGRAELIDINPVLAPGNHYSARIRGGVLCRFDGIHFTIYCGELLQIPVLTAARAAAG